MANRPNINLGNWIYVEGTSCVISIVREPGHEFGDCEVVFNPDKPTNHDVEWDGEKWIFPDRPDFGGYADRNSRLSQYVQILKQGEKY